MADMKIRISSVQILLKSLVTLLIASPVIILFGAASLSGPHDLPPALRAQHKSEIMPSVFDLWNLGVLLYAVGFWLTFLLLRWGVLHRRAAALWWCSLLCGLLSASFIPIGTVLAIPCLVVLFRRRSIYFQTDEQTV